MLAQANMLAPVQWRLSHTNPASTETRISQMKLEIDGPVPSELVGDNGPSVRPGDDPALYGSVALSPVTPVEARSFQTFKMVYTVGKLGIDDTGGVQIAFRRVGDMGRPQ